MNFGRDTAPIVFDGYATLDMNRHHDPIAESGKSLVYRVVDDFEHEVVKASLGGISDVHSRPLPDSLQPLENPYRVRAILCSRHILIVHRRPQKRFCSTVSSTLFPCASIYAKNCVQ